MDPNVSRYQINSGGQFYCNTHRHHPENNAIVFRSYVANANVVDNFENRPTNNNTNKNSINYHESVIKNYKNFGNQQIHSVKRCIPENLNNINLQTKQNYDQRIPNCTNLSNVSIFSSVIQSTRQYSTHCHNANFQERYNAQYLPNNIQTWNKNPNYFCKKLPDFSTVNMESPLSSKNN